MNIRNRLLFLLLPPLIGFVTLISIFFYFNWQQEIISSFRARLKSIVVTAAKTIDTDEIQWLNDHLLDKNLEHKSIYQKYQKALHDIKEKLSIGNIYILRVDPVTKGEPVLLDQQPSSTNKVFDGKDPNFAYRQIILLSANSYEHPGKNDFSESNEHDIYLTKKSIVTPIYKAHGTEERFMTAYAPIMDNNQQVIALVAADGNLDIIDTKLDNALAIIISSAITTILLVIIIVVLAAEKISKPVQKLKDAAIAIAAGEYKENISAEGPQEIAELANTLNTMSECFNENLSQLRENSLARERMHGEYECSLLLQHYMLQKVVESFYHPKLIFKHIKVPSSTTPHGLLLKVENSNEHIQLTLAEAKEKGFEGMYNLLAGSKPQLLNLSINLQSEPPSINFQSEGVPIPIIWSLKDKEIVILGGLEELSSDHLIIFYNNGLAKHFENLAETHEWLIRILRHFAAEGIPLLMTMLNNELNFLAKKRHIDRDIHIFCLKFVA